MKIGIDCRIYSSKFTGIGRCTYELVKHLIRINNELENPNQLVLFFNNPEFNDFLPPPNTKKILVNAKHYSFKEQFTFNKIIKRENLDLMHFPHFNVPIFYRRPYTVTIHDLTLTLFPGRKMNRWYHRLAYNLTIKNAVKKAKKVIAVSENTKKDIIKYLHIPEEKIKVIHNGVGQEFTLIQQTELFQPTLKKHQIKKQFLLYTGVWREHKNLHRLVKAFSLLREKYHLDLQLVITGKEDPLYPEVKKAVKQFALEDEVIFTGMVDEKELIYLYNAAIIYVFPSLYEGFGLPPLESMKCGTPVAASKVSSIPEVCGDNAVFFDPYDTEQMAEKIAFLYKNIDLQIELVENGLKHANKFSWEDSVKKTIECFNLYKT
jgi:glycosyltransferase involved in cell wall biosynthesis